MQIRNLGSLGLMIAALAGCGSDKGSAPTGAGPTTGPATNKDSAPPEPECMEVGIITFDFGLGWDPATSMTAPVNLNGNEFPSYFQLSFGPPGWTGDTSVPGPPDNWCFVAYNLDGMTNTNTDPAFWMRTALDGSTPGVSNCGQESSPGAGDMVTLCDPDWFYGDPVGGMAQWNFVHRIGGGVHAEADQLVPQLESLGYTTDEMAGGLTTFDNQPAGDLPFVTVGWEIDGSRNVVMNGSEPVMIPASNMAGPGGLKAGYFATYFVYVLTFDVP